jgi:lipid-binding SYLF domain-containing protein
MSILKRLSADASNVYQDVYSSWILGDDAGKSATFTLVLRQSSDTKSQPHRHRHQSTSPIGMTFLEVNGRAYVYSVTQGSAADEAGIMPQDAVQFAAIVRSEWVGQAEQEKRNVDLSSGQNDHSLAEQYVLDLEKKGARMGYEQLHHLLINKANIDEAFVHAAFRSPLRSSGELDPSNPNTWNGPPIPSNVCIPMRTDHFHPEEDEATVTDNSLRRSNTDDGDFNRQVPVVFVFRRTRQRKSFLHIGLLPALRLDDECDLASSLVRRLAPSADMDIPPPDTWEELVQDGTDWLLGNESILPPIVGSDENQNLQLQQRRHKKSKKNMDTRDFSSPPDVSRISSTSSENNDDNDDNNNHDDEEEEELGRIPLDEFEKDRTFKLANLRSRMAVEAMKFNRSDDVEAATIRGMIQKAVGLAFVRASKVVLGVSVHGGSGIVIARLSDGTWSAPSAIGTWGLGLGLQFGLEVAEYIFILQTHDALEHFRKGNSFTVGGNMGLAFGGLGREAYGAASVGSTVCGNINNVNDEDQYNDNDSRVVPHRESRSHIAPIVAYAKSQGFYIGVSLEGSRIFTRDDINSRVYKFGTSGRDVSACDILSGKVSTPPEAEELYASLHSVEFAHEMSCLPRPPEILRRDVTNSWVFDRCTLAPDHETINGNGHSKQRPAFSFLSSLTTEEKEQCDAFEARFKNFMYGGVSVQRLLIDDPACDSSSIGATNTGRSPFARKLKTGKERRTLWLMLPEVGSLRLGFVSKLSDGENHVSNISSTRQARRDDRSRVSGADITTVGSEDLTLDSALQTKVNKKSRLLILGFVGDATHMHFLFFAG